jgi:hypothetical protein
MAIRRTLPYRRNAAVQAWLPMLILTPEASSTCCVNASAPLAPLMKVTADIPITR